MLQFRDPERVCQHNEIAHAKLLGDGFVGRREQAELEAESVANIVLSTLGIDSETYSFGYIALVACRRRRHPPLGPPTQQPANSILTTFGAAEAASRANRCLLTP